MWHILVVALLSVLGLGMGLEPPGQSIIFSWSCIECKSANDPLGSVSLEGDGLRVPIFVTTGSKGQDVVSDGLISRAGPHAQEVSHPPGLTTRQRAAIVAIALPDLAQAEAGDALDMVEGAISAAISSALGGGATFILVTVGFGLCERSAEGLGRAVVEQHGWEAFTALHVHEMEGFASAVNRAMALVPPSSIVGVFNPTFRGPLPVTPLAPQNMTDSSSPSDIFMAYDRVTSSPLLMTVPPAVGVDGGGDRGGCSEGMNVPLLVFDDVTYQQMGPLDEGYLLQGAVSEWVQRARRQGWHLEDVNLRDLLLLDMGPIGARSTACAHREAPSLWQRGMHALTDVLGGWVASVDALSSVMTSAEYEAALQKDMDTFYLLHGGLAGAEASTRHEGAESLAACWREGRCTDPGDQDKPPHHLSSADMAYHRAWSGRGLSPQLQEGEDWRKTMRVAAVVCVYDDNTFLPDLLIDLTRQLQHVVVLVSATPWRGAPRDNSQTLRMLADMMADSALSRDRLSVIHAHWGSEAEQRQFGNVVVRSLPGNFTHVMIVDGDEFWNPVELELALGLIAQQSPRPNFAAVKMWTYFKTLRTTVHPPEDRNMLFLVDPYQCDFYENREVSCEGGLLVLGLAKCHHLSYVRITEELIDKKLVSFSHAGEIREEWLREKWHAWDRNHSITDIHPTHPQAYKSTRQQPLFMLPPTLRRLHLKHRKSAEARKAEEMGEQDSGLRVRSAVAVEMEEMMTYIPPRCDLGAGACGYGLSLRGQCIS